MTKPQAAAEPSMEDILASIRKMISEDRLDARPIPDQIAPSIGEALPACPKTGEWDQGKVRARKQTGCLPSAPL